MSYVSSRLAALLCAAALLILAVCLLWAAPAPAQEMDDPLEPVLMTGDDDVPPVPAADAARPDQPADAKVGERHIFTNDREVSIALTEDLLPGPTGDGSAAEAVVLYVSGNRGRTWVRAQKRGLPTEAVQFVAVNDGEFRCVVRGEKRHEAGEPPRPDTPADVLVTVDTEGPVIRRLTAGEAEADGTRLVSWQAEDRCGLLGVKAVAVHQKSGTVAMPCGAVKGLEGGVRFRLTEPGAWHVGVQLIDKAGNATTATCEVQVAPPPERPKPPDAVVAPQKPVIDPDPTKPLPASIAPGDKELEVPAEVRAREQIAVLTSRVLHIGYTWDKEHPPTRVGLWVTRDGGRAWRLAMVTPDLTGALLFRASEDGVYGFHTHRELGDKVWGTPQNGTAPEREVIIDTTPPAVEWLGPLGEAAASGATGASAPVRETAALRWKVSEAFPTDEPVVLAYRAFGEESWRQLAGPMADTGQYDWQVPADVHGAVEVRLSFTDRAGHVTSASLPLDVVAAEPPVAEISPEVRDHARRAYAMATLARLQEKWDVAEEQLRRAAELDPTHGSAWVDLGGIYLRSGRWESAVDVYRKAHQVMPDSANASFGLSQALAARGDLPAALQALEDLLQRKPDFADGWRLYGDVLYKGGNLERARQCWLKALGLGGGQEANLAALQKRLELKR